LCCHGCELSFVFRYDAGLITPGERALSKAMVGLWSAFAANHVSAQARRRENLNPIAFVLVFREELS
jgi:hypothetical protein